MKKFIKVICLSFVIVAISTIIFAQQDSLRRIDSVNAKILNNYNLNLAEIDQQRIKDSLEKKELEAQILSLKKTDLLKREGLEKQLKELDQNDAKRLAKNIFNIDSLRSTAKSFPVKGYFNDTLFLIYSKLGSFSAYDRAEAIATRINKLSDNYEFKENSIKLVEAETTIDLVFGEIIIMSISKNDAIWNNTTEYELANQYKKIIEAEVLKYKSETSFVTLAKEFGLAVLVLLFIAAILFYINKFFKWSAFQISDQEGKRIKGIKIGSYNLFDSKRQANAILTVNSILKWLFFIILIYLSLPVLFGIFPWTEHFADTLIGYILNPAKRIFFGFWNYLPNLFTIAIIYIVFRYVLKGIYFLKTEVENGKLHLSGFYPDWANPTYQILKVVLYAFMFVLIFPYLPGSDSPIFKGVSVFLGVLFTFGSSGSLSNIIAGLVLTYMRLFKIGDRVKIGEVIGDIIEKSMLVTRVRTIKNEIISIPNSTVMSSHTINYSNEAETGNGLIMHTTVTIGYDVPWKKMHQALIDAAERTNMILKVPKPFVLQTSLDDFYVSYQINAYTKDACKQADIYSQLHCNIQDCCNEAGIEILSPHYRAGRDGSMTTIPTNYLDKNYIAPSFNIKIKNDEK